MLIHIARVPDIVALVTWYLFSSHHYLLNVAGTGTWLGISLISSYPAFSLSRSGTT